MTSVGVCWSYSWLTNKTILLCELLYQIAERLGHGIQRTNFLLLLIIVWMIWAYQACQIEKRPGIGYLQLYVSFETQSRCRQKTETIVYFLALTGYLEFWPEFRVTSRLITGVFLLLHKKKNYNRTGLKWCQVTHKSSLINLDLHNVDRHWVGLSLQTSPIHSVVFRCLQIFLGSSMAFGL